MSSNEHNSLLKYFPHFNIVLFGPAVVRSNLVFTHIIHMQPFCHFTLSGACSQWAFLFGSGKSVFTKPEQVHVQSLHHLLYKWFPNKLITASQCPSYFKIGILLLIIVVGIEAERPQRPCMMIKVPNQVSSISAAFYLASSLGNSWWLLGPSWAPTPRGGEGKNWPTYRTRVGAGAGDFAG